MTQPITPTKVEILDVHPGDTVIVHLPDIDNIDGQQTATDIAAMLPADVHVIVVGPDTHFEIARTV